MVAASLKNVADQVDSMTPMSKTVAATTVLN
jgi:hypothetical protein